MATPKAVPAKKPLKQIDLVNLFNSGKPVPTSENSNAEIKHFTINLIKIVLSDYKNATDGSDQYTYEVYLDDGSKKDVLVRQPCFVKIDGTFASPLFTGYTKKDGTVVPPAPLFEFVEAAKEYMTKEIVAAKLEDATKPEGTNWKEFLTGIEFDFPCRVSGIYVFPQTQKQAIKDQKYRDEHPVGGTTVVEDGKEVETTPANPTTIDPAGLPF